MLTRLRWRALIILFSLSAAAFGLAGPFMQKLFIDRLLHTSHLPGEAWLSSVEPITFLMGAFLATLLAQICGQLSTYTGVREATVIQKDLSEKLYHRMLEMRGEDVRGKTLGEVVSIYAVDIPGSTAILDQTIPIGASVLFPILLAPVAIYMISGISMWLSVSVMLVIIILNYELSKRQSRFFAKFKSLAAERTGLVNEWIQNIRTLRILGWVERFERKIFEKRTEETVNRLRMLKNGQTMGAIGSTVSLFINLAGVTSLVLLRDQPVTPGELFALLWIFGVFLSRPFRQIPWILTFTFDGLTSIRRIQDFIVGIEKRKHRETHWVEPALPSSAPLAIEVRGLELKFGSTAALVVDDLQIKEGEFIGVVGEVGSGKSLLLMSLMRETSAKFQKYSLLGRDVSRFNNEELRSHFAFVPQDGFVMSSTLRDNIHFLYNAPESDDIQVAECLEAAQFSLKTESLNAGLDTEIGERGVNLSGGQRQRVSIARAAFLSRPIILLDDAMSALDVDTERRLLEQLILKQWQDRTRVLCTHRLSLLEKVDRVLFMQDGRIKADGKLGKLLVENADFREFVQSLTTANGDESSAPKVILPDEMNKNGAP